MQTKSQCLDELLECDENLPVFKVNRLELLEAEVREVGTGGELLACLQELRFAEFVQPRDVEALQMDGNLRDHCVYRELAHALESKVLELLGVADGLECIVAALAAIDSEVNSGVLPEESQALILHRILIISHREGDSDIGDGLAAVDEELGDVELLVAAELEALEAAEVIDELEVHFGVLDRVHGVDAEGLHCLEEGHDLAVCVEQIEQLFEVGVAEDGQVERPHLLQTRLVQEELKVLLHELFALLHGGGILLAKVNNQLFDLGSNGGEECLELSKVVFTAVDVNKLDPGNVDHLVVDLDVGLVLLFVESEDYVVHELGDLVGELIADQA
jgi:hypothetical protein